MFLYALVVMSHVYTYINKKNTCIFGDMCRASISCKFYKPYMIVRGGPRNSSGGGGGSGPKLFKGGGGVRVQVRGNFHILTSKKNLGGGGVKPHTPPWIRHWWCLVIQEWRLGTWNHLWKNMSNLFAKCELKVSCLFLFPWYVLPFSFFTFFF